MNKLSYTISDFYKVYNEEYPGTIDYPTYKAIMIDLFQDMAHGLLYESKTYTLPYALGIVKIGKRRPKYYSKKSLCVDYKTSKEIGKVVYHTNEHSDGFKYRLHWSKIGLQAKWPYKYRLSFVRTNKRLLAQIIKNKQTDFPEL